MLPSILLLIAGAIALYWVIQSDRLIPDQNGRLITVDSKPERTTQSETSLQYTLGSVAIHNSHGEKTAQIETAVMNGNRIAIPACAGLGGDSWIFSSAQSGQVRIREGVWSSGNPAGLWQIGQGREYDSLELAPWNRGEMLEWYSLDMIRSVKRVDVGSPKKEGAFTSASVPRKIREPGIFIQDNRIVGWTFGVWMERGLLWDGYEDAIFDQKLSVSEFVNGASLNWQEAQFSKGLAVGKDTSPLERFRTLAEGFLFRPQFSSALKPRLLLPGSITSHLCSLASQLIQTGFSKEVVDILSDQILSKASDPELLKRATLARINIYDYWKAARYFERMKKRLSREGVPFTSQFEQFHVKLYKDWIRDALDRDDIRSGRMAFETGKRIFPEDAELHVLGIQQAVSEKNWGEARQLLSMRSYPQNLLAQVKHLEQLLTEKLDTKKIVYLRFAPGGTEITVEASINQSVKQYFILDTGATHVTISSKTADRLGLKITENTPVRPIRTASNVMLAYEVTLNSIEIGDLRADNIVALIIDLPGVPGVGLLGNNFLSHFNVEIDNQNGILKLSPR